jgi:hypothetical protein
MLNPAFKILLYQNRLWTLDFGLKSGVLVIAVGAFNQGLASSIVAGGGYSLESALIDKFSAAGADTVGTFLDS